MTRNWKRVYDQFKLENYSDVPSFKEEKAVLLSIEKNVYHRKTASAVTIEEVSLTCINHACSQKLGNVTDSLMSITYP